MTPKHTPIARVFVATWLSGVLLEAPVTNRCRPLRVYARDPFLEGFVGCKEFCPDVPQNLFRDAKYSRFFSAIKQYNCDNACGHFDFPTVGGNVFRSRAARKEQERERKVRKLVLIECGLRVRRMGNGYVKRTECLNLSVIIIIIIIIIIIK